MNSYSGKLAVWRWSGPIKLHIPRKLWVSWTEVCQNPTASVTGHFLFFFLFLFTSVVMQMLRWFRSSQVCTTCAHTAVHFQIYQTDTHPPPQLRRPFNCLYKWRNSRIKIRAFPFSSHYLYSRKTFNFTQGWTHSELTCLFCELPGCWTLLELRTSSVFENDYQVIGLAPPHHLKPVAALLNEMKAVFFWGGGSKRI